MISYNLDVIYQTLLLHPHSLTWISYSLLVHCNYFKVTLLYSLHRYIIYIVIDIVTVLSSNLDNMSIRQFTPRLRKLIKETISVF